MKNTLAHRAELSILCFAIRVKSQLGLLLVEINADAPVEGDEWIAEGKGRPRHAKSDDFHAVFTRCEHMFLVLGKPEERGRNIHEVKAGFFVIVTKRAKRAQEAEILHRNFGNIDAHCLRFLFLCLAAFVPFFRCRHGFGHSDLPVFDATGPFVLLIRRLFGQKESRASFPCSLDGRAKQEVHFTYEIG